MAKVTIEDISQQTGLSRGTVSRALNNRPDISPATRQRVLEACTRLNYIPSFAARSLATGRSFAVAVVVRDLDDVLARHALRGLMESALSESYAVHVVETGRGSGSEPLRSLSAERIDGALLVDPLTGEGLEYLREALADRKLVSCQPLDGLACDVFEPDDVECGRLAARVALRRADARVCYVHHSGSERRDRRRNGFVETFSQQRSAPQVLSLNGAEWAAAELPGVVRTAAGEVDVLVTDDDRLAVRLMLECVRAGRRVGGDVAVIGQGNAPCCEWIRPTLTSIDPRGEEIGRRAMEAMRARLAETRQDPPQHTRVAPLVIERDSTRNLR